MANQNTYVPDPEELGRRRFPDDRPFRRTLANRAADVQGVLQSLLPSNYSKEPFTNLGSWYRVAAREASRNALGIEAVSDDKQYSATRVRLLQQVLGERLFLGDRIAPAGYNDESYRQYLLAIKDAYLAGSKKTNLEVLASRFTGLPVRIKELYLEARDPLSSLGIWDTHKMVVDVLVDDLVRAGYDINKLKSDLDFFINLARPAHVLYDTRLIWTETYNANKIHDIEFGDTGGGCTPIYNFSHFEEPTYLAALIFALPDSRGATGVIEAIHEADYVIYLQDGSRIVVVPGDDGTHIYDVTGRRISLSGLQVLQNVRIASRTIPGSFQFWWYPDFLKDLPWYAQFYPDVYKRPAFQENVKKEMDAQGRFWLQTRATETTLCDRWVQDDLDPLYEDIRHSCYDGTTMPSAYSSELATRRGYPRFSWPWDPDPVLLGSPWVIFLPHTPVTDGSGNPAVPADVSLMVDGTAVSAISAIDASSGRVTLLDSRSWWDASFGRAPVPGNDFNFSYHYRGVSSTVDESSSVILGPFALDATNYPYALMFLPDTWVLPHSPAGSVATLFDGTWLNGAVAMDGSRVWLNGDTGFWDASAARRPVPGDSLTFEYNYTDYGTDPDATWSNVFSIGAWQMPHSPLMGSDGTQAVPADVALSVDGTSVPGAVIGLRPLLGHVMASQDGDFWRASTLGRLPTIGDVFRFSYAYGERYQWSMLYDDIQMGWDSYLGGESTFGLLYDMDASGDPASSAMVPATPLEIGYRYRGFFLPHSSVLNSPDTLNFNTFQKPANRASIVNQCEVLNHFNEFWSAEFLYDKNRVDKLTDQYLENGLDPVVKLKAGTPTFQQTFGYQPHLVEERKPQDVRTHHHPLMYSDLLLKEFPEGGGAPINTICDSNKVRFEVGMGSDGPLPISECLPWILFDTMATDSTVMSIPGDYIGVPNLRVVDKLLRQNFILREVEPSGTATWTYTVTTTPDTATNTFQFPETIPFVLSPDSTVYFPSLPVMADASTLAGPADVSVTYNGTPWSLASLNPLTGVAVLTPFPVQSKVEVLIELTAQDAARSELVLPGLPLDPTNITLTTVHGTAQMFGVDYYVYGRYLSWYGTALDGLLAAGDKVRVSYAVDPLVNAKFEFTYKIMSTAQATVADEARSRILDNGWVLDGCGDGYDVSVETRFDEYPDFLDDSGEGIKLTFFNRRTAGMEDHVFSGPVFESWDASQDEIGPPEGYPDSLVRVGLGPRGNPLKTAGIDYGYLGDRLMRFRKKTFKELLPDRSFRSLELTEMLPI